MAHRTDTQLDYRTCVRQVEQALVRRLALAFKERLPPVLDKAALRTIGPRTLYPSDLVYVQQVGHVYAWAAGLVSPDNDASVLAPINWTDSSTGHQLPGVWVEQTDTTPYARREDPHARPLCAIPDGYLRSVELYQGRPDTEELFARFTGRRPLLAIRYAGDTRKRQTTTPATYRVEMQFQLIGLSYHPRRGGEALEGATVPGPIVDSSTQRAIEQDPGLFCILGDADDCAQGDSDVETGYYHLVPGVDTVLPTGHQILQELQAQRLFVGASNITVVCNVHRPDWDAERFYSLGLTTQAVNQHQVPAAAALPDNAVLQGLDVPWPQDGLLTAPRPGRVAVAGQVFALSPPQITFTASSDTYRYCSAKGRLLYQVVPAGSKPPTTPPGALLIGVTTTDGVGIVFDELVCATVIDQDQRDVETVAPGETP
jgi:hypothetical protein